MLVILKTFELHHTVGIHLGLLFHDNTLKSSLFSSGYNSCSASFNLAQGNKKGKTRKQKNAQNSLFKTDKAHMKQLFLKINKNLPHLKTQILQAFMYLFVMKYVVWKKSFQTGNPVTF